MGDEEDMGLTYEELQKFGRLRTENRCGPISMYKKLVALENAKTKDKKEKIAEKVKKFFTRYAKNRHKMTTMTPSVHADSYSPDDNRHDLRPIFTDTNYQWQFDKLYELVNES